MCVRCSTRAVVLAKLDDPDIWLWVPTFAPWHMGLPAGYDVWAKVIEALADIGYDTSTMVALPYDWRLSVPNLEFRDGYFTRLRFQVQIHSPVVSHCTAAVDKSALSCDWADGISRCSQTHLRCLRLLKHMDYLQLWQCMHKLESLHTSPSTTC
jgi:Lecithin:cholesterol acyltransferase